MASTYTRPFRTESTPTNDQFFLAVFDKLGQRGLEDVVTIDKPVLRTMMAMKDSTLFTEGGEQIRIDVWKSWNPNGGWTELDVAVELQNFDPYEALYYDSRVLVTGVINSAKEQVVLSGGKRNHNIVEDKIMITKETVQQALSDALWGSGGGSTMDGLINLIPALTKTSQTTAIGGKKPSDYSWHQSQIINMTNMTAVTDLEAQMKHMLNVLQVQNSKPRWIFTDMTTHELLDQNAKDFLFTGPTMIADMEFTEIQFRKIPVMFDDGAPDGEMRFINPEEIKFAVHPQFYMYWDEWKQSENIMLRKHKHLMLICNMVRRQGRKLGCIYNI